VGFFLGVYFVSRSRLNSSPSVDRTSTKIPEKDQSVTESNIKEDEPTTEDWIRNWRNVDDWWRKYGEKPSELEPFQSILGKVVFVTKGIYGGDLWNVCILKGKVRNVTNKPYKNIYVVWVMYGKDGKLFPVIPDRDSDKIPSMFVDKIDYLDSKSEAEFNITIDMHKMGLADWRIRTVEKVIEAVKSGREEACIFIRKESSK
jgi:hypothetical protein